MGKGGVGEVVPPVPAELTTSQYVILAENQRKKAALADSKQKYSELLAQNRQLQEEAEASRRENFDVTEYMRREILAKEERLAQLQAHIDTMDQKAAEELAAVKKEAADREKKAKADAEHIEKELRAEIMDIKEQLEVVMEYKAKRQQSEEELAKLRVDTAKLRDELKDQAKELERKFMETSNASRKEYEHRIEELRRLAEEDIDDRLDASMKRILAQNRSMKEELRLHIQETEELSSEVQILDAERQRLFREVQIKTEMEKQYAKRGTWQAREIREANDKVASLELSLGQVMKDFAAERQRLIHQTTKKLEEAETERAALRRLIKLKTRELKNIRRLAHEVLMQRGDVETFLISSLKHVREELERESLRGAEAKEVPLTGQKLDIKELSWGDREKVLRLLFAKINNQAQQAFYANLPAHSFETYEAQQAPEALQGLQTEAGPAQLV
ncbi:hypothetical protein WJX72_007066 [[Myrmecia] bisecta]|uniref:Basal body-orientation factor 1 n=1 Tax=[Myrmecia] bisecta TaxID=41462 RepID=A0AAW1R7X3_9CHLO